MKRGLAKGIYLALGALAGCSQAAAGGGRSPNPAALPLVNGAQVVEQVTLCDRSANAFCGVELVVVDGHSHSSGALVAKERFHLGKLGWTFGQGDIPDERSASSPDGKLRVIYTTASADLLGVDLGWISRSRPVALALSRAMFNRQAAMSLMLETGPA